MNAADERSLESIRQKVFPFLRVDWRTENETAPRFLILDECETLTEAAHLSLQTIMNTNPAEICVILICNSQSRIHPKLRQRLLKIRYDPPHSTQSDDLFTALTRGDLRQHVRKADMETRIWSYLNAHPSEHLTILRKDDIDLQTIATEIMLLADTLQVLDNELIENINIIYPLLIDSTILQEETEARLVRLLREFKQKIDERVCQYGR